MLRRLEHELPGPLHRLQQLRPVTIANAAGDVRPYVGCAGPVQLRAVQLLPASGHALLRQLRSRTTTRCRNVRVYAEFDFTNDQTDAQIAPGGAFLQPFTLNDNNPLLSQSFKDAFGLSRRQSELARSTSAAATSRAADATTTSRTRTTASCSARRAASSTTRGTTTSGGSRARTRRSGNYQNDFSVVAPRTGARRRHRPDHRTAGLRLGSSSGTDPNCVPVRHLPHRRRHPGRADLPADAGHAERLHVAERGRASRSTSDLGSSYGWTLPWAKDGVGGRVRLRAPRREAEHHDRRRVRYGRPGRPGRRDARPHRPVHGERAVRRSPRADRAAAAVALRPERQRELPLLGLQHRASRRTRYGLGVDWAPVKEDKLRGSYQQAVRAPNVIELFTPQGFNLFERQRSLRGVQNRPPRWRSACGPGLLASSVRQRGLDSPAGQYNYLQGGNPNLAPETAKTYTVGLVLTPMPNLSATIDYWHYNVDNMISSHQPAAGARRIASTPASICDLIHRGANGNLWLPNSGYIAGLNQNIGSIKTDGFDITFNYAMPIENYGGLGVRPDRHVHQRVRSKTPIPGLGIVRLRRPLRTDLRRPAARRGSPRRTLVWNTPWNWSANAHVALHRRGRRRLQQLESAAEWSRLAARRPHRRAELLRPRVRSGSTTRTSRSGPASTTSSTAIRRSCPRRLGALPRDRGSGGRQRQHVSAGLRLAGPVSSSSASPRSSDRDAGIRNLKRRASARRFFWRCCATRA